MFDFDRMMRRNGKKPTARERWKAVYRLFRIVDKIDEDNQSRDASDCLRVLGFSYWILRLKDRNSGEGIPRNAIPLFLRKAFLNTSIRQRLYGEHPEWEERDKRVARHLHSTGVECTPQEVGEVRQKLLRLVKDQAIESNFDLPNDDNKILEMLRTTV